MLRLDLIPGTGSATVGVIHPGGKQGGNTDRADALFSTFGFHFKLTGASKSELRLAAEMSPGTFYRALSDLLESGRIVNTATDKRPFYKLAGE